MVVQRYRIRDIKDSWRYRRDRNSIGRMPLESEVIFNDSSDGINRLESNEPKIRAGRQIRIEGR